MGNILKINSRACQSVGNDFICQVRAHACVCVCVCVFIYNYVCIHVCVCVCRWKSKSKPSVSTHTTSTPASAMVPQLQYIYMHMLHIYKTMSGNISQGFAVSGWCMLLVYGSVIVLWCCVNARTMQCLRLQGEIRLLLFVVDGFVQVLPNMLIVLLPFQASLLRSRALCELCGLSRRKC